MIVAFIDRQISGKIIEPPKCPHITVKKKFKLVHINENQLIKLLQNSQKLKGVKTLKLGGSKDYGNDQNKIIEVLNPDLWTAYHMQIFNMLENHIESRDPHFEDENYLPHVTWKLRSEIKLNPDELMNKTYAIEYLYLIQRVDPIKSRAKVVAEIKL